MLAVYGDPASESSRTGAEAAPPEGITEDCHGIGGQGVVGGTDEASKGRLDAEDLKASAGDAFGADVLTRIRGIVEPRGLKSAREAHGEQVGPGGGGVAEKLILDVAE